MTISKKLIILSKVDTMNCVGIVRLEKINEKCFCEVKLYDDVQKYSLVLSFLDELIFKDVKNNEKFVLNKHYNFLDVKAIVVVGELLYALGSTKGSRFNCDKLIKFALDNINPKKDVVIPKETPKEEKIEVLPIAVTVDENVVEEVTVCKSGLTIDHFEIEDSGDKNEDKTNFYNSIMDKMDLMFNKYKKEQVLIDRIENSKWVRVEGDDNNYYVVGIIYVDDKVKYICYGVPAKSGDEKTEENAVWYGLDNDEGYWMIYQSAEDGRIIKEDEL